VSQVGTVTLHAVQLLLPVEAFEPAAFPHALSPSLSTAGWFRHCYPSSSMAVRVTLDSGQAESITMAATTLLEWMNRLDQDTLVGASASPNDVSSLATHPPFHDRFWNGPPRHPATFQGRLAEWSLEAVGWLGGFLGDLVPRPATFARCAPPRTHAGCVAVARQTPSLPSLRRLAIARPGRRSQGKRCRSRH
jgi:hypothetical protein